MRLKFALAVVLLTTAAFAQDEGGLTITVDNQSRQAVDRINTFPLDDEGQPIEDNVGGIAPVPAGQKLEYRIASYGCGDEFRTSDIVRLYVIMEDQREFEVDLEPCIDANLVVRD